ncbi:MAG TPA: hypothetical protein VGR61_10055, partial [Candidatus Dormibacteraeota bacterium]|nr:hypothetical protein [Candidatus Dormibacteraeota bacterium]
MGLLERVQKKAGDEPDRPAVARLTAPAEPAPNTQVTSVVPGATVPPPPTSSPVRTSDGRPPLAPE